MSRPDRRSVRRWLLVSRALMCMLLDGVRATPAVVARIVPVERRTELRRRLLVCAIAFIVAFLVALLPIPFVSSVSLTQAVIQFLSPSPPPGHLQFLELMPMGGSPSPA